MREQLKKACALALVLTVLCSVASGEMAATNRKGQLTALRYDGEYLQVQAGVRLPLRGWRSLPGLAQATDVRHTRSGPLQLWTGRIEVGKGAYCQFRQTLEEAADSVQLNITVTAEADLDVEGVFLFVDVPISVFAGGLAELVADGAPVESAQMPPSRPQNRHFLSATAASIRLSDAAQKTELAISLDRPCPVMVQDTREWRGTVYQVYARFAAGPMRKGQTASLGVSFRLKGEVDRTPARLRVEPQREIYRLDGFGGNYCFAIESPVTQYTLDNLHVAWARTEMTPAEWEPQNDNGASEHTDWQALKARDTPGSNLRREFLLAQEIQRRGIPYVISIWHLPEWLYADPGKGRQAHGRRVPREKWPELLECLGSYLLYAREAYGVEPDLFSFNEPNYGVRVKLSPEEHRDAIKAIGAHFERLGLRTKMLLADVANPRSSMHTYALPAAEDAEAMRYVGAVAFHSWGGATPSEYAAWADLGRKLNLPLLVTELGVDANWRAVPLHTFHYALREVRMYQELILHARPQGTMQWEFTSDYSIVDQQTGPSGETELAPTTRFWFVKHFCDLTPVPAIVLGASSDNPRVLLTAFRSAEESGGEPTYALHIANFGSSRVAHVAGLPAHIAELRAVRTSETESFQELGPVTVRDGTVELTLAANSLLTLTTPR